jgi:hypothetical protein
MWNSSETLKFCNFCCKEDSLDDIKAHNCICHLNDAINCIVANKQ